MKCCLVSFYCLLTSCFFIPIILLREDVSSLRAGQKDSIGLVLLMDLYYSLWVQKYTPGVKNKDLLYSKLLNHGTKHSFPHYFYAKIQTLSNPDTNCFNDTLKKREGEVG